MFPHLYVVAHLDAKPGCEAALRQELLSLIAPTRKEDGCILYDLHESTAQPGQFVFYEIWESQAHLDRHLATPHLQHLGQVGPDLMAAPPRVLTYSRIA